LFDSINKCNKLRHLTLETQDIDCENKSNHAIELPVLGWLEEFNCSFYFYRDQICEQLIKHGVSNRKLTSIALADMHFNVFEKHFYKMNNEDFYQKFSLFPSLIFKDTKGYTKKVCRNFTSLQKVDFN